MRSFGHLSATSLKPSASSARTTATPTASDRPPEPRALLELPPQREVRLPPRSRSTRAAAPPCRLPFGGKRDLMDIPPLCPPHELGGRGLDLVDDLDRARQRVPPRGELDEPRLHLLGVEEIGRLQQAVAAALDPLQRKARRAGILQHLRDACACQPHLGGKILA